MSDEFFTHRFTIFWHHCHDLQNMLAHLQDETNLGRGLVKELESIFCLWANTKIRLLLDENSVLTEICRFFDTKVHKTGNLISLNVLKLCFLWSFSRSTCNIEGKKVGMPIYEKCGQSSVQNSCMPDFTTRRPGTQDMLIATWPSSQICQISVVTCK